MAGDIAGTDGLFQFEDCLLKHFVRTEAWLPFCRRRLKILRGSLPQKAQRRLKYFTFCAVGAIDVLMLDVAKVIARSPGGRFDTVYFFHQTPELVDETIKRIPGAIGFPGDFVDLVLTPDPLGDDVLSILDAPSDQPDNADTRRHQIFRATRRQFLLSFPFDVINLDLERFFFRPNDPIPGQLVNAMRTIFQWQCNPCKSPNGKHYPLGGFTLLFTTQIGPPNLGADYLAMLRHSLLQNLEKFPDLVPLLEKKAGTSDVTVLERENFAAFFKLAVPKTIAKILDESDWHIDEKSGVKIYEFDRNSVDGPYTMLHLAMDVKRKQPPFNERPPGQDSPAAQEAYSKVVRQIFDDAEMVVSDEVIDKEALQKSLERIKSRRRKYNPEEA